MSCSNGYTSVRPVNAMILQGLVGAKIQQVATMSLARKLKEALCHLPTAFKAHHES